MSFLNNVLGFSFNTSHLTTDDRAAIGELQNQFQISFVLNDLCHTLMGRVPPGRGAKVDTRKYRITPVLPPVIKPVLVTLTLSPVLRFSGPVKGLFIALIK